MIRIARRSKVLSGAIVAVATVAVTAGSALAASGGIPGPPTAAPGAAKAGQTEEAQTGPQTELTKKQEKLIEVAQKLAAKGKERGSDFAGVSIDPDAQTVHLFRKDKSKGSGLDSIPAGVTIDVDAAKFSRNEMLAAAQQITDEAQLLGQQFHVTVEAVGPTVDGSGINVTVFASGADDLGKASKALHDKYGTIVNKVNASDKKTSESELYFAGWRFNDYAPWYGGDRITTSSGSSCTTGFAATYNGAPVMLTAAHCGGVGTNFWNGPTSSNGWNFMGSLTSSNTNTDVATLGVSSYSLSINVGSNPQVASQLYVGSWASPIVGEYLCQSGSFTGERCGLRVVDTAQYVCLSYVLWWCTSWQGPLADVISIYGSSSPAAGHGDSGGPVYLRTGTSGIAKGLVHGQLTPNAKAAYPAYYPDTLSCPSPDYGMSNRCSSGFSFAHMPGY
jgi:hypothetical protein